MSLSSYTNDAYAEYYNQVKEEKESKNENALISVDDLGRIDKLADLCFYFEMNMPEVKRDVFYILSCISIWKEEWFEKVKERFDNYLLTTVHYYYCLYQCFHHHT